MFLKFIGKNDERRMMAFRCTPLDMKYTQFQLLKNGLTALPVLTAVGGGTIGYVLSAAHGVNFEFEKIGQQLAWDIAFGAFLGLLGGVTISCFGHAGLHHVNVEDDPKYKDKRKSGGSAGGQISIATVYDKSDLEDHKKSMMKTLTKYKEKMDAEKVERTQILEIGTKGIEEKRKAQLGIKSSTVDKSGIKKSGVRK